MTLDLESPAAAFSRQARLESQITALMSRAMLAFLGDVRALTLDERLALMSSQVVAAWQRRTIEALEAHPMDARARDYVALIFDESLVPDEAYAAAQVLIEIAVNESWTEGDLGDALAEVFSFDDALVASGGAAKRRRDRQAAQVAARSATARAARDAAAKAEAEAATAAQNRAARTPVGGIRKGRSGGRGPRHGALWDQLDAKGLNWAAKMRRDARTAVTGLDGMNTTRELAGQGYTRRRWVTMHDDRVRDTHRAADGQTVGLDEEFTVGGASLRYPGDRLGPASEVINCRCIIVGVRWRAS